MDSVQALNYSLQIKHQTKEAHLETERSLIPLLKSIRSKDDYGKVLQLFYGYYAPLEEKIESVITEEELPDLKDRRKASLLHHDLSNLQIKWKPDLCTDLPTVDHLPQAFGALYVLEGSTLGGVIISKMLQSNPHAALDHTVLQFFSGYGEDNMLMWERFQEHLQQAINNDDELQLAIAAANETFLKLKKRILNYSNVSNAG
jgi:heme oxygenase (biliverdin-IX-beta and delta-forming)